ncbi:MAG: hypothetical protein Q9166_005916 [cf. Caloplaca sp. 2 TL-2023]
MGNSPEKSKTGAEEPIAIVGTGCRFPGSANSPSRLWDLLCKPRDLLTCIPKERFNVDAFYHPDGLHHGTTNVTESYFLHEDHRLFDAGFFNIKPVEAHSIDPQQRLLLETVYESLESAGIPMETLVGSQTGVYVGLMCGDYSEHLQRDVDSMPTYMPTGTARSIISNRISYFFDWHGPSMTIDTACSSSLVAVHQAVQLLRSGDSEMAIAAGANIILEPELYIGESKLKMLSPGSRSRMWDVGADGYARGEGIAAIVMKRLSTAIRDGDHIECVIRASGLNQDGRTKGITMPSQVAQADLIARTYAKAGLDPRNKYERCQFFEAHGTGTTAGDAVEAEAISRAFFGPEHKDIDPANVLYVGSVKTVIGHTEGTAGLAGLLKASLAIQHGVLPPNMLFNTLSPTVAPFYDNLEIPTSAKSWPDLPLGVPRRASINSFGFGGSNAHVLLENFEPYTKKGTSSDVCYTPLVFSATSEQALQATLATYSTYMQQTPDLSHRDLSYTLHAKRSTLPVRSAISAESLGGLAIKIGQRLEDAKSNPGKTIGVMFKPLTEAPRVLGVFTGQGAQWPTMGRELLMKSAYVRGIMEGFDQVLQSLPDIDRPSWSLTSQMMADSASSRVGEAIVAQPLCTAIQIILVDLLHAAGINFKAVVGHSSGEIAAAYASGFLARNDALKIAYYRGFHTKSAEGSTRGAMMAVGTSMEDATELCQLPAFESRLCVAACNSPSSITLSGDADAIDEAKEIFEEEKKFARLLKVEKAYHSHHMLPCSDPYVKALRSCHIGLQQPANDCAWFSSTSPGKKIEVCDELAAVYWKDNMVSPVLFSQAVEAALKEVSSLDVTIEIGPHSALKGPVLQNQQDILGQPMPYTGMLERGTNDIQVVGDALGFLWSQFGSAAVDLGRYDDLISGGADKSLVKSLPLYQWNHDRIFWHDSRASRAYCTRKDRPHPLLGSRVMDGIDEEMRWKNLLKPSELPWVHGHQLQAQTVLPAAAYVSTAVEASKALAGDLPVGLIEVCDFAIGKPLTFDDDESGVETVFILADMSKENFKTISATFTYHACTSQASETMTKLASGRLVVIIGDPSKDWLPAPSPEPPNMVDVDEIQFYASLDNLGYGYTGDFRTLASMRRKLNFGSAKVSVPDQDQTSGETLLIHPAMLDAAFQAIFLAYWWPNDGSFEQLHVPTSIQNIRVNLALCEQYLLPGASLPLNSHLTENPLTTTIIKGDVDIFDPQKQTSLIQVEGVKVVAFAEGSAQYDHQLFSEHIWDVAFPNGELAMADNRATKEDYELARALERISLYYLKVLDSEFALEQRRNFKEWNHEALFDFATFVLTRFREGRQPFAQKEWLDDTREVIEAVMARYPNSIEMKLTRTVGENLPLAVRGDTNMLQHLFADNLLNTYYTDAMGLREFTEFLASMVSQIVHRYPHMEILEIGAGTGGATKSIMRHIGLTFSSYTYTDISTGFFEEAQTVFADQAGKMVFKALDVEKEIDEQGYVEHSYDLVIGSLVLHATRDLRKTLGNARKLLKPGGYLLIQEITNIDVLRVGFAMSGLPGWWLGREDGRRYSPCVTSAEWHSLLQETGFSGIDSTTPEVDILPRPLSIIAAQATNEQVDFLRKPLLYLGESLGASSMDLVVVGGQTLRTVVLIDEITRLLRPWRFSIISVRSLHGLETSNISPTSLVLSVTELDKPIWEDFSPETMNGLKKLMDFQRTILWVTQGCRSEQPYMNMSVGFGRSLALEMPDLRLQFMDLDASERPSPQLLVEALLRLHVTDPADKQNLSEPVLWSTEQEIVYEKGRQMIPRLLVNKKLNDRYNASKRTIIEHRNPQECALQLRRSGSGYNLVEDYSLDRRTMDGTSPIVDMRVAYSLLKPIATADYNSAYIVLGDGTYPRERMVGLSPFNGNRLAIGKDELITCNIVKGKEPQFLAALEIEMRVNRIISFCMQGSRVLIHGPTPDLAEMLEARAVEKNLNFWFCSSSGERLGRSWLTVHPRAPSRTIKAEMPMGLGLFINCLPKSDSLGSLISECLPPSCLRTSTSDIDVQVGKANNSNQELLEAFRVATNRALSQVSGNGHHDLKPTAPNIVTPGEAARLDAEEVHGSTIVQWTGSEQLPLQLCSVDSQTHFAADKTDITDREAVESLVAKIHSTFPPIAGISHGAMVLEDTSFSEMSYETMQKVLRPKVLGCIYLDELFQDKSLDFFIFFSSLASISGNRGQSNYSAANLFLAATANQRRSKGLAGSVLHIGAVMGVGYVTREVSEMVFSAIRKAGFKWMSERGLHQCIAEAIIAGRPSSSANPEIVTGLRMINPNDEEPAPWMDIPRFQHCIIKGTSGTVKSNRGTGVVSTKVRLFEATSKDQVLQIIKEDSFVVKLQIALQISLEGADDESKLLDSGADDLGVDSLVAVDIRAWFLKELEVDMPVLKILGGATLADLSTFAVEKLPKQLVPNVSSECLPEDAAEMPIDPPIPPLSKPVVEHTTPESESSDTAGAATSEDAIQSPESPITSNASDSMHHESFESPQIMQKVLPMSPGQSRFWFLSHLLEDQTTSNIAFSIELSGSIREQDFENAVRMMGARHEALRTCFFIDVNQKPMQGILSESSLQLMRKPISDPTAVSHEFEAMKNHVFDVEHGEIMRVLLLSLNKRQNFLIIGYHHINMDGVSLEVFLSDLEMAYNHKKLPEPVIQYPEYSVKQRQEIESGNLKQEIQHWKSELAEPPPPLPLLPFSSTRNRSSVQKYDHHREDYRIDDSLQTQIKRMCQKQKTNPFHFYLAVFEVLLFKLLGTGDFCVGMADAGRMDEATSKSIGIYLNLLPLRFRLNANMAFADVLKDTRKKAYSAMAHSRVPFDVLLEELRIERSTSYSPLFQAFINYRQGVSEKRSFGSFEGEGGEYAFGRTPYDISLDIMDNLGSSTLMMFMVQKQFYSSDDAKKLVKMYFNLVKHFTEAPKSRLDQASLFATEDVDSAVQLGQGPRLESSWPSTLAHRIDEVALRNPNAIALKDPRGTTVSYKQLRDRSSQIACALLVANIKPKEAVVVYQEPSFDWICSLLAVMRVGAVYVPFDANIPLARLQTMLETCHPSLILVHDATVANAAMLQEKGSVLIKDVTTILTSSVTTTPIIAEASDPIAILYTSGTTGIPKGVVLSHSGLRNQVEGVTKTYHVGAETVLQQTALSFDLSLDQVMTALCNGGTLVIAQRSIRGDSAALADVIAKEEVTHTSATPSEYLSWLQYGSDNLALAHRWTSVLSVGEQYPWPLVEALRALEGPLGHPLRLFNVYGPTEVTISSNRIELPRGMRSHQRIPAGYTLPNCSVYIVDGDSKPVPIGMPGEVLIGGAGVSVGYLTNDTEKFIPDSLVTLHARSQGWTRAYRTGDMGVLRDDGALEVLGRIAGDTQLKLRGIRIEMGDIENTILHAAKGTVSEVLVVPHGDTPVLVAYAVLAPDVAEADQKDLIQRLLSNLPLPQYMRPAAIIPITAMPLTAHGKLDRRTVAQLPIEKSTDVVAGTVNLTSVEVQLRDIWKTLLPEMVTQLYTIDADSDFFHVGGNSMLLINLQRSIRENFNVDLPVIRLFESSTLGGMAAAIKDCSDNRPIAIDWEHETAVPLETLQLDTTSKPSTMLQTPPHIVILTGSTGFLGKELLRQLLQSDHIQLVHCIAVRDESKLAEFASSSKVLIHKGDLRHPQCGLSDSDVHTIFSVADAVIHNGADVSFLKSFASLRLANVTSTKALFALSLPRRIPFHYISSIATGRITRLPTFGEVSLSSTPPPLDYKDNYAASKWASEVFLEKASMATGSMPVWIHRPSSITGEGVPELDIMHNLLIYSVLTGMVPASDRWKGVMDFVSVERTAEGILRDVLIVSDNTDRRDTGVVFRHQASEIVVPVDEMKEYLERETEAQFEVVGLRAWIGKAREQGLNALVGEFLEQVEGAEEDVVFQRLVKGSEEEV